ncbi:hypothetical protein [Nocardia gipuzkoensis]
MLVTIIDDAVGKRLQPRQDGARPECPAAEARPVPVHTESIGEVAARMAALWEVVGANAGNVGDLPES